MERRKKQINRQKHRISFEEVKTAFYDEYGLLISDPGHSEDEDRFILLGFSRMANLLVVCHCYRQAESVIRSISARKATTKERESYNCQLQ